MLNRNKNRNLLRKPRAERIVMLAALRGAEGQQSHGAALCCSEQVMWVEGNAPHLPREEDPDHGVKYCWIHVI